MKVDVKPQDLYVWAEVEPTTILVDVRPATFGFVFGAVEDVCRQYGIKYQRNGKLMKFNAPKTRLQAFVEKLHFSAKVYHF